MDTADSGYAEIYKAADGWRWRMRGANHEVIATGEAYTTKSSARRGLKRVSPTVAIKDLGSTA
jgi:uncharacterized protein YegP (UPF0339 family)